MNKTIIEIRKRENINSEMYFDILFFKNNGNINLHLGISEKSIDNELLETLKIIQEEKIDDDKLDKIAEVFSKYSIKKVGV